MDPIEALEWRYAVGQFTDEQISEDDINQLLNAVRLTPSAYGLQPYKVLLIDEIPLRQQLVPHTMQQEKIAHCSHLLVLATYTDFAMPFIYQHLDRLATHQAMESASYNGKARHLESVFIQGMTAEQRFQWAKEQSYIALGTLLTCAAVLNIDSCPMTGFEPAAYDDILQLLPQGLTATALVALGTRHPEDERAQAPKVRPTVSDLIVRHQQ